MDLISLAMGLAQFAPWVVKLITGSDKAEQAAGKVVEIAQAVTGKSSGSDALAAIQGDPSLVLKFRETVGAQQGDLEKAFLADVQDARHRDTEIRKQTGGKNSRADLMIVGDLVGLVACMVILIFFKKDLPGEVAGILNIIAAGLVLCLRDAHQFEFGSSRGSKEKDDILSGALRR